MTETTNMLAVFEEIGKKFRLKGSAYSFSIIKNGNINSTYKVTYRNPDGSMKAYVFQKINTFVFTKPVEIMENIDRVTTHIRTKNAGSVTLHFHHTDDAKNFVFDEDGSFWRVMNCIDSITFDTCDDLAVICSTGKAFGQFQMDLADFDGSTLYETIPDFHNTRKRLDTLFAHAADDPCGRCGEAKEEIESIAAVREKACELCDRYYAGEFPVRVTHNDTKSNNVLFDRETKQPLVVIDLDTVMPGMAMYDFGDAVRFIANTAAEDEPDLSRVFFDTAKYRAFAKGFIGTVRGSLTQAEVDSMTLGAFSITVELAARFLDDYLTGDKYFKVNYPGHNLVRTRCQLKLAKEILAKYDELQWIIRDVCRAI